MMDTTYQVQETTTIIYITLMLTATTGLLMRHLTGCAGTTQMAQTTRMRRPKWLSFSECQMGCFNCFDFFREY